MGGRVDQIFINGTCQADPLKTRIITPLMLMALLQSGIEWRCVETSSIGYTSPMAGQLVATWSGNGDALWRQCTIDPNNRKPNSHTYANTGDIHWYAQRVALRSRHNSGFHAVALVADRGRVKAANVDPDTCLG